MEPVYKFLEGQIGLGGLVLLILVGIIVWLSWKLGVTYTKYNEKVSNLPCDKHEQTLGTLGEAINSIKLSLTKLETMLAMMSGNAGGSQLTQSHSPVSLTTKGEEIAKALDFGRILNENWDKMSTIISGEKNPYDIQVEFITKLITDHDRYVDADSIDRIKKDAFMRGIPLIEYLRMLGVMARDKYFKEHGIDIGEVDSNDPNKGN